MDIPDIAIRQTIDLKDLNFVGANPRRQNSWFFKTNHGVMIEVEHTPETRPNHKGCGRIALRCPRIDASVTGDGRIAISRGDYKLFFHDILPMPRTDLPGEGEARARMLLELLIEGQQSLRNAGR